MRWLLLALFVVHVSADLPSCSGARCFHCEVQFIARMCPTVCGECTKTSFTNLVNTKKDAGSAPVVTKSTVQTVVHPATVSQDAQAVAAAKAAAAPTQNVQTPVPQAQVAVAQPRAVAQPQAQLPVQQRAPQPAVQQYQQPQQQQYNQQPQQPQQQFYQQNAQQPGQQFARPAQPVQQQFQQPAQQQYQQPGQQQYQQPGQYQQPAQQQYQQPGQQQYQQPGQQQFQQPAQPQYQQPAQAQYQTQGQQQYQQPAQKPQYQQQGVAQQFQQQPARPQQPYAATPAPQVSTSTLAPIAELPRPDTNLAGRPADLAQPLPEYTRNPALPFYNPPMLPQVNPLYPQQNSQQQSAFFNPFQPFLQHTAQAGGQTNPMDPFGLFGGANAFGQHNMFGTQQAATPAAANNGQAATQNYNQYYNQGQYTYGNEAKTTGNQQNYQQYQQGQYQQGQTQPTAVQPTQQAQYTTNSNTQSSQATVVSPQQQASSNSISNSYVKALSTASEKTCPRQPGWLPCISKEEANTRFSQCCVRLGDGCAPLCNYDANLATMQLAVLTGRCALSKVADVMICASGYVDVTECCQAYNVFEPGFEHCRPYCNPAAGLPSGGLLSEKYKCLAKLSAIQQCFYVSQKPA